MTDHTAEQCARQLRDLALDPRFAIRSSDLEALADDIETPDGDSWADVDLFAAFPAEATTRLSHRNLAERLFGVFAVVSVFLPVAWTWWSFHDATDAYERLIREDGEPEGRTFLSLWATGFEGRLQGSHELVPMALVSVLLIVFAIFTLVVHRLIAGINVRREERAAQEAHTALVTALTRAQLILSTRRANHPLRVEGIIKSSMKKLREAHEAARQVIADLSVTSATVGASVRELVESAQLAGAETTKLMMQATDLNANLADAAANTEAALTSSLSSVERAVTSSLAAMEGGVNSSLATVGDAVTSSLAAIEGTTTSSVLRAQQAMDASSQQLRDGLTTSLDQFESAMAARVGDLRDDTVAEIRRAGETLQSVVERIGSSAERNAAAAGELTDQVGAMSDDNATTRAEFIAAIADVRAAVEGIEAALLRHESALQGQASELTGARDSAERMLRRLTSMNGTDSVVTGS